MFITIPIGHEDSQIKRFPVVSCAIVFSCLWAFGSTWPRVEVEQRELSDCFYKIVGRATALRLISRDESQQIERSFSEDDSEGTSDAVLKAKTPLEFLAALETSIDERRDLYESETRSLRGEIERARTLLENRVFNQWGLVSSSPSLLGLFTHMFLHGGYLHLIFNLLFFVLAGPTLEDLWGRMVFPVVYVVSGLAAALGFMAVSGGTDTPMIGASGAIAGLMGAFLGTFANTRIRVAGIVLLPVLIFRPFIFYMPAWAFLPIWIGGEILSGVAQLKAGSAGAGGVAHWAHIAGFFFGLGVPFLLRYTGLDVKLFPVVVTKKGKAPVRPNDPAFAYLRDARFRRALRLREEGDWTTANECLVAVITKHPDAIEPRLELAELCRAAGEEHDRRRVLQETLAVAAAKKHPQLLEVYGQLRTDSNNCVPSAEVLLPVALAFAGAQNFSEAAEHYRKLIQHYPEHPWCIRAAENLADLLRGPMGNPQGATDLLRGLATAEKDPFRRREFERKLERIAKADAKSKALDPQR